MFSAFIYVYDFIQYLCNTYICNFVLLRALDCLYGAECMLALG